MSGQLDVLADFFAKLQQWSVNVVGRDRIGFATTAFGHKQTLTFSDRQLESGKLNGS